MKKYLSIFLCIVMVAVLFTGCQNYLARRTNPNTQVNYKNDGTNMLPNDLTGTGVGKGSHGLSGGDYGQSNWGAGTGNNLGNGTNIGAGTGLGTGTNTGMYGNGGIISAEFTKSDVVSCKTTAAAPIKTGCGTNYSTIANIPSGQMLKVLGDLGNWYVVQVPNSNRVGAVQKAQTTLNSNTPNQAPAPIPSANNTAPTATGNEARILQLCNAERAKVGAKALVANSQVANLARLKSEDMVNKNYFDHTSPTYGSPFDMMKKYGVSYMYAGENIAMNQTADKAFQAWMNSEGHKRNILNPNFTELGVGIASKGNGSYIYTQMFIGK